MKTTKVLSYKLKRALPILGIAGASVCNINAQDSATKHDIDLHWDRRSSVEISFANIQNYLNDTTVNTIYLTAAGDTDFAVYAPGISDLLCEYMSERINMAPSRIRGRGNIVLEPGTIAPCDSLWFVNSGWTINQR